MAAPAVGSARRAQVGAFLQAGEHVEAMKFLMYELKVFAEQERIHEFPLDTRSFYKNPAELGYAFKELGMRVGAIAVFSEILELRGATFLAFAQPRRALEDLEAAAELSNVPRPELQRYLSIAEREVAASLEAERGTLRFHVGDSVKCKIGRTCWQDGDIVRLWWQHPVEKSFHPYQVKLRSDQRLIYVPVDDDECIRKIERAWWEKLMARDEPGAGEDVLEDLSVGKNLDAKSYDGETALLCALRLRWCAGVHTLLRLKADPNCAGRNGDRALNVAVLSFAEAAQAELTKALLEAKANPQLQDKDPNKDPDFQSKSFQEREWHRSALHYAAEQGRTGIMRLLLDARAEVNVQDAQYKMPLHLAAENSEGDAVRMLIDNRADMNSGHMEIGLNTSPLIDAAYRDDQALMQLLINAKASLDQRGKQDMTALHVAARGQRTVAARILVTAGADTTLTVRGKTAGELAFKNGLLDLAALLGYSGEQDGEQAASKRQKLDAETRAMLFMD